MKKGQIAFAAQALIQFVGLTQKSHALPLATAHKVRDDALYILEKLQSGDLPVEMAVSALNAAIAEMNKSLTKENVAYPTYQPNAPMFEVKNDIVAFEYALDQGMMGGHLDVKQQQPLFREAVLLWRDTGLALPVKEAVSKFRQLVVKYNDFLPEKERYPTPDENNY